MRDSLDYFLVTLVIVLWMLVNLLTFNSITNYQKEEISALNSIKIEIESIKNKLSIVSNDEQK